MPIYPYDGYTAGSNWIRANQPVVVTNVSALRALDKTEISYAVTKGYYTAGDGGAGEYWYDSSDTTSTDNQGTVIVGGDGGRWKLLSGEVISVKTFGAKCDFSGTAGTDDTLAIQRAITQSYGKTVIIPSSTKITQSLVVSGAITICGGGQSVTTVQKTADFPVFKLLSNYITIKDIWINGGTSGSFGFTDSTSGIQVGTNDGASGQSSGYVPASQCVLQNIIVTNCGKDGVDWEEGPFLRLSDVHCNSNGRHGFYVSQTAFDASHGEWNTSAAGNVSDDYSINWGTHEFVLLKSFCSGARGVYLNKSRGSFGNIFVELSTGASIEFGVDTLANNINLQFWTTGKNYIDSGIGNRVTAPSMGGNNGGLFESFLRTNKILVRNELLQQGSTSYAGGLLIDQVGDNSYRVGDSASSSPVSLQGASSGVCLKGIASHSRNLDLSSSGSVVALSTSNQYANSFLLQSGQTLQLNGASGSGYTPFDGQTVSVWLKGSGTISVYGWIDGTLQTITQTTTNRCKTYVYQQAQGFWFPVN